MTDNMKVESSKLNVPTDLMLINHFSFADEEQDYLKDRI
jgi:hypothetical protein